MSSSLLLAAASSLLQLIVGSICVIYILTDGDKRRAYYMLSNSVVTLLLTALFEAGNHKARDQDVISILMLGVVVTLVSLIFQLRFPGPELSAQVLSWSQLWRSIALISIDVGVGFSAFQLVPNSLRTNSAPMLGLINAISILSYTGMVHEKFVIDYTSTDLGIMMSFFSAIVATSLAVDTPGTTSDAKNLKRVIAAFALLSAVITAQSGALRQESANPSTPFAEPSIAEITTLMIIGAVTVSSVAYGFASWPRKKRKA